MKKIFITLAVVFVSALTLAQNNNPYDWSTAGPGTTSGTTSTGGQSVTTGSTSAKTCEGYDCALAVPEQRGAVAQGFSFITNAIGAVADTFASYILAFLVLIALCLLIAAILFVSFLADAVIYAGLCLGPLILALTPMKFFRGMIPQYIKFMITGVFYKLVAAVFVVMITKSLMLSAGAVDGDTVKWAMMIGILIQIFIMIAVVKQAPSVASSLIGGFSMSASGPGLGTVALLAGKVK